MTLSLRAEQLGKTFNRRLIFDGVSFVVNEGQTLLVTGRNGSGKSTLMKIIARVLTPSKGTIALTVGGDGLNEEYWHDALGFVSPYLQMYEEFSPRENLALALSIRGREVDHRRIEELLSMVSLSARGDDPVRSFSSGMKQRVKYAFALVHDPAVLILDEPTTNLDTEGVALVKQIMQRQRERGILLVATNDLTDVEQYDARVDLGRAN